MLAPLPLGISTEYRIVKVHEHQKSLSNRRSSFPTVHLVLNMLSYENGAGYSMNRWT